MTQEEFHQYYENESERLFTELSSLTEDELLAIISDPDESRYLIWEGRDNFQIWRALQAKGSEKAIKPLYAIVSNLKNPYLVRYHACTALFHLARLSDDGFKGEVQYGLNSERQPVNQQQAIERLGVMLGIL
jgi:hypothetical protein